MGYYDYIGKITELLVDAVHDLSEKEFYNLLDDIIDTVEEFKE